MKKSFTILAVLGSIMGLVLATTFKAGENHVVVVEEKEHLEVANDSLTNENTKLTKENNSLKEINKQLTQKIEVDSLIKEEDKKKDKAAEAAYLIALYSLEKIVKEELSWISPEAAYEAMELKLARKPTQEEFDGTLRDLYAKKLLYHYIPPDPYMKGQIVKKSEIPVLVQKIIN